ncbi:MAG: hypothetical protein JWP89_855 [Schlesneria sp.]|nr:hypothetical protein [Schlesneria sp.]
MATDGTNEPSMNSADDTFLKSMFYEQLVEYVFVSEVLQEAWYYFGQTIEVLRSEVDSSGYDIVFECNGIMRHVQLKTSRVDARASSQKVNIALASKPSGCIVWLLRNEDCLTHRMRLSYLFFGGEPGQQLPSLDGLRIAKTTKANTQGIKKERNAIRIVPKSRFQSILSTRDLVGSLFGLRERANQDFIEQTEAAVDESEDEDV